MQRYKQKLDLIVYLRRAKNYDIIAINKIKTVEIPSKVLTNKQQVLKIRRRFLILDIIPCYISLIIIFFFYCNVHPANNSTSADRRSCLKVCSLSTLTPTILYLITRKERNATFIKWERAKKPTLYCHIFFGQNNRRVVNWFRFVSVPLQAKTNGCTWSGSQ